MPAAPDFSPHVAERETGPTPLGARWRARGADGQALDIIVLAPALAALVRAPEAALAVLRTLALHAGALPPELVPVVDAGRTTEGALWIAMPAMDAPTAAPRLARGRPLSSAEVTRIGLALAPALEAAHGAGVFVGAALPSLLHLADEGPRLVGAGVLQALVAGGAPPDALLVALEARGYVAPELAGTGEAWGERRATPRADAGTPPAPVTPAADVYALGAALYALLTSRPPFGGRTTSFAMAAVLADEPGTGEVRPMPKDAAAQRQRAEESERLTSALLRAVERAPDDRWPEMRSFALALEGRTPTPAASAPAATPAAARGRGCAPALVAMTGILGALLFGGAVGTLMATG